MTDEEIEREDVVEVFYPYYELVLGSLFSKLYGCTSRPLHEEWWWREAQGIIDAIKDEAEREAYERAAEVAESLGIYGHAVSQLTASNAAAAIRALKSVRHA